MKKTTLTIIALSAVAGLAAACSSTNTAPNTTSNSTPPTANRASTAMNTTTTVNTGSANNALAEKPGEETPAAVKAAFPDAQSFTKQHKDISRDQIADIEKDAGAKVPDTDHHSYLAFSTAGGARKQIGAATLVKAIGKDLVIVYENKEGSPVIKEVRGEGIPASFLQQFAGKGHDAMIKVGSDLKVNGADDATAKAIADAVRVDAMTMQALYGAAHKH